MFTRRMGTREAMVRYEAAQMIRAAAGESGWPIEAKKACRNFVVVRDQNCVIFRYLPSSRLRKEKRMESSEIKLLPGKAGGAGRNRTDA